MDFDIAGAVREMFAPVFLFLFGILKFVLVCLASVILAFLLGFLLTCRVNPFRPDIVKLRNLRIRFFPYSLMRWLWVDLLTRKERSGNFKEYGFTLFVGRQGSGKTISMVHYLSEMKKKYPNCKIATNFAYSEADYHMESWRDFFELRNGTDGMIFALDEIHSEYSSADWKDFPESLLSEISQQRKQRIKIVATAQVFSRVAKPIREQAFSVVCCSTYFGRFTYNVEYDAAEYATGDTPYMVKKKCRPVWRSLFVQSDDLRSSYDTYEKIERLKRTEFIPRSDRG